MDISYRIVRSRRKTVAIHVKAGGEVELRCPVGLSEAQARKIIESKLSWIQKQRERQGTPQTPFSPEELAEMKKAALPVLTERTAYFAPIVGVSYGKIAVRSQKSLWGSCSRRGNLSFNCLLALAPPEVADYVVVHELCHRRHMNHSKAFWQAVEQVLPDYRQQRKWLREQGGGLIQRLRT